MDINNIKTINDFVINNIKGHYIKTLDTPSSQNNKKDSLLKTSGRGAFYQICGGGIQTLIRIVASMFLARTLFPEDFGIYGMGLLLGEFILRIGSLGMGVGIIVKKDLSDEDLSTAFWIFALLRIGMFLIAFGGAPVFASFFHEPRVADIIRVISLSFLIQIIGVVGNALLNKRLQFKRLFYVNLSMALLESLIALLLVTIWIKNYWGLVIAYISTSICRNLLIFLLAAWVPKFTFSQESFKYLFRYGINTLGHSITVYFKENIDYLLVGKILGATTLGFYEFAYRIPSLFQTRIALPMGQVMFATLAKVSVSEKRLQSGYVKGLKFISLITLPALGGLAVTSELAVSVLWGNKWLPIILPMQILCLATAINSTTNSARYIFLCKDRPDIPFKFNLVSLFFTILAVCLFGYLYGIVGVAIGMLVSTLPNFYYVYLCIKMINLPAIRLFNACWPIIFATAITMISAHVIIVLMGILNVNAFITLPCSILAGIIGFVISLRYGFKSFFIEIIATLKTIAGLDKTQPHQG